MCICMHPIVKLSTIIKNVLFLILSINSIFKDCISFTFHILNSRLFFIYTMIFNHISEITIDNYIDNGWDHCWVEGLIYKSIWIYVLRPLCAILVFLGVDGCKVNSNNFTAPIVQMLGEREKLTNASWKLWNDMGWSFNKMVFNHKYG